MYLETRKLRDPFGGLPLGFADIAMHTLFKCGKVGFDCRWRAFCFQMHTSVRQIFHPTSHLKFLCHLKRGITKTNTLYPAGKKDRFVMDFRHSVDRKVMHSIAS